MKSKKTFIIRVGWVFLATLITVAAVQTGTQYYGNTDLLNTFILAILVAQIYSGLIDPREIRDRRAKLVVMEDDIDKLKSEIKFLKYFLHKQVGIELSELELESSIWRELSEAIEEQRDKEETYK